MKHYEKMSIAKQGSNNPMFRKHHTIKTKKKLSKLLSGNKHPRWNGGKRKQGCGYIWIYSPEHPYKNIKNCVSEHRLVMETYLGRVLLPTEIVHHINGIRDDNRIENLMLYHTAGEHHSYHAKRTGLGLGLGIGRGRIRKNLQTIKQTEK